MSQYRTGTIKIVSGESTIEGTGTTWLTNIDGGDAFKVKDESVVYEVASVSDNTHLFLSTNYQGTTRSGEAYQLTRDFTANLNLTEINPGDIDWPTYLTEDLRTLDAALKPTVISKAISSGEIVDYTTGASFKTVAFYTGSLSGEIVPGTGYKSGHEFVVVNEANGEIVFDPGGILISVGPGEKKSFYYSGTSWK